MNYRERDRLRKEWAGRSKVVQTLEQVYRRTCARANDAGTVALAADSCLAMARCRGAGVAVMEPLGLVDPAPSRAPGVGQIVDGEELEECVRNARLPIRIEPATHPDGLGVRRIVEAGEAGAIVEEDAEEVEWRTLAQTLMGGEPWLLREEPTGNERMRIQPVLVLVVRTKEGVQWETSEGRESGSRGEAESELREVIERTAGALDGQRVVGLELARCPDGPRVLRCWAPDAVEAVLAARGADAVRRLLESAEGGNGRSGWSTRRAVTRWARRGETPWVERDALGLAKNVAQALGEVGGEAGPPMQRVRYALVGGTAEQREHAGTWPLALDEIQGFGAWRAEKPQERCLGVVPGTARWVGRRAWARKAPELVDPQWSGLRWGGAVRGLAEQTGVPIARGALEPGSAFEGWEGWSATTILHVFTTKPWGCTYELGSHLGEMPLDHAMQIALAAVVLERGMQRVLCGLHRYDGVVTQAREAQTGEAVEELIGSTPRGWAETRTAARRVWEVLSRGCLHQRIEIRLAADGPRIADVDPAGSPALAQWAAGRGLITAEVAESMTWWRQRRRRRCV